jgi:hypothetical protein
MDHRLPYTVADANAALPHVRETLTAIHSLRDTMQEHEKGLAILDALWGEEVSVRGNPDHAEYLQHRTALLDLRQELEATVKQDLIDHGIRFPVGGLEHGLVDFPTTLDGRWVYLCWKLGENHITHWHEIDGGFRGRQELTSEVSERMGLADDPARGNDAALDF